METLRIQTICFNDTKTISEAFITMNSSLSVISCDSCEFELLFLFQELQKDDHSRIPEIICSLLIFSVNPLEFGE